MKTARVYFITVLAMMTALETASEASQIMLTQDPRRNLFTVGETIKFICQVNSSDVSWQYSWSKVINGKKISLKTEETQNSSVYTITLVTLADAGQYVCEATQSNGTHSANVTVQVAEAFKTTLSRDVDGLVLNGEAVTLQCLDHANYSSGTYLFYYGQDGPEHLIHSSKSSDYTINCAEKVNEGKYWCRSQRQDYPYSSGISNYILLEVNERPLVTFNVTTTETGEIYETEFVTMKCQIGLEYPKHNWTYRIYRAEKELFTTSIWENSVMFSFLANVSKSGQYICTVERTNHNTCFKANAVLDLEILPLPKPELFYQQTENSLHLSCSIKGNGWKYYWYKSKQNISGSVWQSTVEGNITVPVNSVDNETYFWCQGQMKTKQSLYSEYIQHFQPFVNEEEVQKSSTFHSPPADSSEDTQHPLPTSISPKRSDREKSETEDKSQQASHLGKGNPAEKKSKTNEDKTPTSMWLWIAVGIGSALIIVALVSVALLIPNKRYSVTKSIHFRRRGVQLIRYEQQMDTGSSRSINKTSV
ncbi:basement membrane-specific heparan sulfate proteoglycan core protein-like [Erpetoichthys calabaricus]|uniref:basement membrane-specific heparan sulfate proteoglycan core protein-like n=1 Tax=Erpetoichthys calabaricus TaxID=27687 RepID=UPI002233F22C|nr:basement membrane-specific heparan sulfate proteoglycan core protein-like [Erpetoichthys calabaricus]